MKCPKCEFENPEEAKFCNECGNKLEKSCPECGKSNPPGSKFCNECGHNLTLPAERPPIKELTLEEKFGKIQKYLPKGIAEKILSQRDRIEGERKQVTVMFCDMEGFTGISEKIDPEEVYSIMDQVYEILIHKVHDYEGTVNEFTGDGIMALFGAPIALEDAPQRAIRSAYAMHREMTRFSDKLKSEKENIPPIKMRIGIHTGPVVVGTLGNDLRVEFKAVGDTVNLASRIEGLAEPGATYVSEETFKLTEGLFRFEALGEYAVKGKAKSVKAYRVIAPSTSRTRFDVSAERGLTQFVGRDRELEILLDGFERSKTGRGQACSIVSEAGVGKSRLLYEFRKAVANEDVIFQEGKCLSYSKGVAYHPIIDIVKSNFDLMADDDDVEIRAKLNRGLKILDADEASTLPYLLELLSVKDSGVDPIALSPEARKDRIIKAIIRITIKASQIRPLIIATEDLHWIDSNSEDYLKALLDSISGARAFLIFTYRPEFVHAWGAKSYHSQVNLNRLSNRESLAMVTNLLGTRDIGNDLEELILEKTDGVPFFIEEFIKSLNDLNAIEKRDGIYHLAKDIEAVSIPSTIQDVIMARVDKLPEGAKNILQTGSVIEREFSYELIKAVSGSSEQELLSQLSVLKDSELIFERGIYPESTYVFKHALTQEVVYDTILTRGKKELHNKIGQSLEQIYKDNLHEHYAVLAEHFISSDDFENGSKYCRLAAKKAEKTVSLNDAIDYGEKQVSCLEKLPKTEGLEKNIIDAKTVLGLFYGQMSNWGKAKAICDSIIKLAEDSDYKRRIAHIYCILGACNGFLNEDISKASEYLKKALKIGLELNDPLALVLANTWMGQSLTYICEFKKAHYYLKNALEINVAGNVRWGITALKCWIALNYFYQGKIDFAHKNSLEALQIADESGDIVSKAHAYTLYGYHCFGKGNLEEAEEYSLLGIELSDKIKVPILAVIANDCLAYIYFDIGEYEASQRHYQRVFDILRDNPMTPSYINLLKLALLRTNLSKDTNIELESMYALSKEIKYQAFKSDAQSHIGEILLVLDDNLILEAEGWIKRSIKTNQKYGMMFKLAQNYALYAELFKRKDEVSQAKEKLITAIGIFKECGADGWVVKYENELAALL